MTAGRYGLEERTLERVDTTNIVVCAGSLRFTRFLCSGEVRKIVAVVPDAHLSLHSRLSFRDLRGCVCVQRQAYRSGARRLSKNSLAPGIVPALNWQGALVVRKMKESNRHTEEPVPAGVPALAEEIDERLSSLASATTAEL